MCLVLAHFAWWSVLLVGGHRAPELDSAEQLVWSYSLEGGYWKHPPLPSWLMHGLVQIWGPSVGLPAVAAQAGVAIALWCTWQLGRELMPPARALVGVALAALVTYHGAGADAFNHTTLLLPFQAAMVWAAWRALTRQSLLHWSLVGLLAALALLVKYAALLPLAGLLLALALDVRLRAPRNLAGLLLAAFTAAAVLAPHLWWLLSVDFLPLRYARSVSESAQGAEAARSVADFVLMQALRLAPLLAVLAWLRARGAGEPVPVSMDAQARRYLWINALAPVALTLAWGLASRSALPSRWGANEFMLAGLLAVSLVRLPQGASFMRRTLGAVLMVEVIMGLAATLPRALAAEPLGIASRANFPGDEVARLSQGVWHAHVPDRPLRLVVSDVWLGGNLVARGGRPLAVLIDGQPYRSPWVGRDALERCGALVLDDATDDAEGGSEPHATLEALVARADFHGEWQLPWSTPPLRSGRREFRERLRWAVIPPRKGAEACPL